MRTWPSRWTTGFTRRTRSEGINWTTGASRASRTKKWRSNLHQVGKELLHGSYMQARLEEVILVRMVVAQIFCACHLILNIVPIPLEFRETVICMEPNMNSLSVVLEMMMPLNMLSAMFPWYKWFQPKSAVRHLGPENIMVTLCQHTGVIAVVHHLYVLMEHMNRYMVVKGTGVMDIYTMWKLSVVICLVLLM